LQTRDFLRAILEGRPPLVTGSEGRIVVAMFEAIYRSQRERRSVRLV
jgi:UDP-N-acetyl-2-amino-2-deoxyglucuronate dehydrogenase